MLGHSVVMPITSPFWPVCRLPERLCADGLSPRQGLFHKAIGQSAACVNTMPEQDANGYARGARLLDALAVDSMAAARAWTQKPWSAPVSPVAGKQRAG